MALTPEQKSSRLFKKSLGAAETLVAKDFFEEPKLGKSAILTTQIWAESDSIPTTAPVLSDGQTLGVVKYYDKLTLNFVAGSTDRAYSHDSLKNAIPFNFGDGSYNYGLFQNDGTTAIAFGEGDWLIDTEAGVLTFYGTLPAGVTAAAPPRVSFYQYVGEFGLPSGTTSGIHTHAAVRVATTGLTDATYSTSTSGFTNLPSNIDGITTFSEGDRILIKNQTTEYQNGVYVVSGTTLVRASDHDGNPGSEIAIGDYVFVFSGTTNKNSGWALSDTNGDPSAIIPGVNTQVWEQFSASQSYTADGNALQLTGNEFKVVLNETGLGSGLEQSINGLRVTPSLMSVISGAVTGITSLSTIVNAISGGTSSLSTALSSEISDRLVAEGSLETVISTNSSNIVVLSADTSSLSTALSTEISNRLSGDTSLTTALSLEISGRTSDVLSLSSAIDGAAFTGVTSLETEISVDRSNISVLSADTSSLSTALSTEISNRLSGDTSLTSALSVEISDRTSADLSLATVIDNFSGVTAQTAGSGLTYVALEQTLNVNVDGTTIEIVTDTLQLTTAIQNDISNAVASGTSLSTAISINSSLIDELSGGTSSLETAISIESSVRTSEISSLETEISGSLTGLTSLDSVVSVNTSNIGVLSADTSSLSTAVSTNSSVIDVLSGQTTSLSTALSGETDARLSGDLSLSTAIANFSGITAQTAGSGLTFNSAETTLNVNVDDYTIKIVNDEIRGSQIWIQSDKTTTIATGTGATNITLTYNPVTPVMVQVNGIEYLVNTGFVTSATDKPFYFNTLIPTVGSVLYFDATEAGFGLESGVDLIIVKYNYVSLT
jgi:hypothetical protein